MKFTIFGFNQEQILKYNLSCEEIIILKIIADIYFSTSEKITSVLLENTKYIWLTYKYIQQQIPIIGTERTLVNKISSLIEKGFLKKIVQHSKNGRGGNFLYFALGENYKFLVGYENSYTNQMKNFHEDDEKISSEQVKNFHNKDNIYNNQDNNIKNKYIKPRNCPPFILDIMKKYEELNLPDYEFLPDNHIFVNCIQTLGAEKLFKALEIISKSEYAKTFSINMIFNIKNLKKALNGSFRERNCSVKNRINKEQKYEEDKEAMEVLRKLGF